MRRYYYFCPLIEAAYNYIVKHFMIISEQGNELMKLRREELKKIIENDKLNVKCEELVWDVIVKWVDYHPVRQKSDLLFLLPKVRFGLMDFKYFIDNVSLHYYINVTVKDLNLLCHVTLANNYIFD